MKPSRAQYFFAQGWPIQIWFTIWFIAIPLLVAYAVLRIYTPTLEPLFHWWSLLRLTYFTVVALLLGFFLVLLIGSIISGPLYLVYYVRGRINGAPFRKGDLVRILAGPYRDRIVKVYGSWQGDSVRVELGEREKEEFKDIFSPVELLREEYTKPDSAPNADSTDAPSASVT